MPSQDESFYCRFWEGKRMLHRALVLPLSPLCSGLNVGSPGDATIHGTKNSYLLGLGPNSAGLLGAPLKC